MKRIYKVNIINRDTAEINYSLEAKNIREVKNILIEINHAKPYTVTKRNKLIKKLSSKSALEAINNSLFTF